MSLLKSIPIITLRLSVMVFSNDFTNIDIIYFYWAENIKNFKNDVVEFS